MTVGSMAGCGASNEAMPTGTPSVASEWSVASAGSVQPAPPGTTQPVPSGAESNACQSAHQALADENAVIADQRQKVAAVADDQPVDVSIAFVEPVPFDDVMSEHRVSVDRVEIALYPYTNDTTLYASLTLDGRRGRLTSEDAKRQLASRVASNASNFEGTPMEHAAAIVRDRAERGDLPVIQIGVKGSAKAVRDVIADPARPVFAVAIDGPNAPLPSDPASLRALETACAAAPEPRP